MSQAVPWYANVTILSNAVDNPTLIIGPTGNVITQIGITFTISGNTIYVNDISGNDTGQVFVNSVADTADNNVGNNTDDISGSGATWSFVDTLGAVTIINYSPMNVRSTTSTWWTRRRGRCTTSRFWRDRRGTGRRMPGTSGRSSSLSPSSISLSQPW